MHDLICLFYDIEKIRHSLGMRGLELVDGAIEQPWLSLACLGSNPRPAQWYPEVLLTLLGSQQSAPKEPLGGVPRGAVVKVTGDTWTIPDIVILT